MNKILILIVMFFCCINFAFAQQVDNYRQDTTIVYQREKGFFSDPIRSKWRQEVKKEGDTWVLRLYNKKNILQELIPFADKNLEERKGVYTLYQNGCIKEEGNYDKGYKVGEWKYYYPNMTLSDRINYTWDKLYGASLSYWDNGQLKASKNYVNGVKNGEWKFFHKDGKLASTEVYNESGKLEVGIPDSL